MVAEALEGESGVEGDYGGGGREEGCERGDGWDRVEVCIYGLFICCLFLFFELF